MILLRINGKVSLDSVTKFVEAIVEDEHYDPSYRIIVNDKNLEESSEVEGLRRDLARASNIIGSFFADTGERKGVDFCFCHDGR